MCPEGDYGWTRRRSRRPRPRPDAPQDPVTYRVAMDLYAGELLRRTATRSGRREEGGSRTVVPGAAHSSWRGSTKSKGNAKAAVEALKGLVAEDPAAKRRTPPDALVRPLDRQVEALTQYERLQEALSKG